MGNETIPSLPSVSSPNATDLVPIEHGAAGGPYTTSQTTIAELVAAGGGGSSSGGSTTPYDSVIVAQSPAHYWPLNDAAGATSAADAVSTNPTPLTTTGTPTFGYPPLALDAEDSVYAGPGSELNVPSSVLPTVTSNLSLTFICSLASNSNETLAQIGNSSNSNYNLYIQVINGNFEFYNGGSSASSSFPAACGVKYHVALVLTYGSGIVMYVNGMPVASQSAGLAALPTAATVAASPGRYAKVAYWETAISVAEILAQVTAAGL